MKIRIDPEAVLHIIKQGLLVSMFQKELLENATIKIYQTGDHQIGLTVDLEGKKREKK